MDFQQYMRSQNPNAAISGAMAGPTGGSYGQLAMQVLGQNAQRQQQQAPMAQQPQSLPGGPSLPDPGPNPQMGQHQQVNPSPALQPAPFGSPSQMAAPQMQDPEYQRGYQIGMMLRQMGVG